MKLKKLARKAASAVDEDEEDVAPGSYTVMVEKTVGEAKWTIQGSPGGEQNLEDVVEEMMEALQKAERPAWPPTQQQAPPGYPPQGYPYPPPQYQYPPPVAPPQNGTAAAPAPAQPVTISNPNAPTGTADTPTTPVTGQ